MKKPLLLLCVLFVFMLCACGTNSAQSSDGNSQPTQSSARLVGDIDGNTYINKVIGFSAAVPEGWNVASLQQMSRLFDVSVDYLNGAAGLEPDSQMFIFYCSKYSLVYNGPNPGIGVQVSNQSSMTPLLSSEQALNDYLEQNRSGIEQQFGDAEAKLSCDTGVQMGANKYSVIHISANYNGAQIMQDIYFLGVKGYVLMITETYSDISDKPAADSFLESLSVE